MCFVSIKFERSVVCFTASTSLLPNCRTCLPGFAAVQPQERQWRPTLMQGDNFQLRSELALCTALGQPPPPSLREAKSLKGSAVCFLWPFLYFRPLLFYTTINSAQFYMSSPLIFSLFPLSPSCKALTCCAQKYCHVESEEDLPQTHDCLKYSISPSRSMKKPQKDNNQYNRSGLRTNLSK